MRWVVITGARGPPAEPRRAASKPGNITAQLALIGQHLVGPPNVKASPGKHGGAVGASFLLQTANEPEDEEDLPGPRGFTSAASSPPPRLESLLRSGDGSVGGDQPEWRLFSEPGRQAV